MLYYNTVSDPNKKIVTTYSILDMLAGVPHENGIVRKHVVVDHYREKTVVKETGPTTYVQ